MIQIPNVPVPQQIGPDLLYRAMSRDGDTYLCRDWRVTALSSQIQPSAKWTTPYLEKRRRQTAVNVVRVSRTISDLRGVFPGRDAYVVLSGPSIRRNLKEHPPRPNDIVIGVNQGAAEFYAATGRAVDFLLVADGIVGPAFAEEHWGHAPKPGSVVANISCDPSIVEWNSNPFWFRQAGWGHETLSMGTPMDLPELEYSFNSGSMVLHLADIMGCTTIVLVGCDQALTGGEFHPGQKAPTQYHDDVLVCPDIHGNLTMARFDQFVAARKIETWAWMLREKYGVKVVNLTGAGILKRFVESTRN